MYITGVGKKRGRIASGGDVEGDADDGECRRSGKLSKEWEYNMVVV